VGGDVRTADPHVADAVDGTEVEDGAPVAGAAGQRRRYQARWSRPVQCMPLAGVSGA
jgi:hypothetical protein